MPTSVSVVMPVRNEERHLRAAVQRVLDQHYPGDLELILAVGPSEDRTRQIADEAAALDPRVIVLDNPTGYTPAGLNIAIAAARHPIVVRVDGHGELSPDYIATAVDLIEATGAANVGGLMDARGSSPLSEAVAAAYNSRLGLGGGGFHLAETPAGPADTVFLGVFRKEALREIGGFDETLHRAQDWELNYRLRNAGHTVYFSPELRVVYRPRDSYRALVRQFFTTGQWRREVARRHPDTVSLRYLAPPAAVAGMSVGIVGGLLGLILRNRFLTALFVAPLLYLAFLAAATVSIPGLSAGARLRLPLVLAIMHIAWGAGFIRGIDQTPAAGGAA
ncbi:Glycosyltransferase like family 2 [Tessaracoccus bendigoensis DSM 12906]|uniref:Glycosyltransferase like family 2 n=1 Tax=Tessaracoccus bendigoensis DSM 12906 TaxID=1123357 RepID=A0A1M6GYX1_9ACTN|nr:glycosyltransferase family 2 protein [Tessaracoccus bendigoensis]SHJ15055.1 Glycosyltransferase like family 2 [Tessaracoccus bendigoensis DSM 12906]